MIDANEFNFRTFGGVPMATLNSAGLFMSAAKMILLGDPPPGGQVNGEITGAVLSCYDASDYGFRAGPSSGLLYLDNQKPYTGFGWDMNYRTSRQHIFECSVDGALSATVAPVVTINHLGLNLHSGKTLTVNGATVATVSQLANYLPKSGGQMTGPLDNKGYAASPAAVNNFQASVNDADPSHQLRIGYYNNGAEWGSAINSVVAGAGGPLRINPSGGPIRMEGPIHDGIRDTGSYFWRLENLGSNVPVGSTGQGLELIGAAASTYSAIRSYNRTTAAFARLDLLASNFEVNGPALTLRGTNPGIVLNGDASSYYNTIQFDMAYGVANYTIGGYNGCQQNLKSGMFDWMFNSVSKMTLDANGSLACRYNISGRGGTYNFGPIQGDAIADCIMTISTTNYYPTISFTSANGGAVGAPLVVCGHFMGAVGGMTHMFDQHNFNNKANSANWLQLNASGAAFGVPITQSGSAVATVSQLASYAPLASPALTGNPTATTQTAGNNTTRLATTAFVTTAVANSRTPALGSTTSNAGITPNVDNDISVRTTQTVGLTVNAPTGTAIDGLGHVIRIKATAAVSIGFAAIYRAIGVTLPTALVSGKTTYIGMIYNALDTKWDITGVMTEA
jgi:hypothetical protein